MKKDETKLDGFSRISAGLLLLLLLLPSSGAWIIGKCGPK